MVVDYSKWDDLNTLSSEDEAVTKDAAAATPTLSVFEGHRGPEARERLENPRLGHERKPGVMVLAFADASTVVSGGADSKCRIWDARVGSERLFDTSKRGVLAYAYNTIFSVSVARSRGIVATAAGDGCLRCFDFETGESAAVYLVGPRVPGSRVAADPEPGPRPVRVPVRAGVSFRNGPCRGSESPRHRPASPERRQDQTGGRPTPPWPLSRQKESAQAPSCILGPLGYN